MFKTQTIREKDVIGFDFNTACGGRITVGIKYIDEDRKEKIRQDCTESLKKGKFRFKNRLYNRMIARETIEYIHNMTYEDINFIIEPIERVMLEPGKNWKDYITYDQEVKEFVIKNMIEEFADFITEASTDVEIFHRKALESEMKNLTPGSAAQPGN